jgi:ubiquinone/menaquinone biosynthesis C-methylase UbiE
MPIVCPWWLVYTFDNALRPLFHNPQTIFAPYVKPGMTVMDVGCGRGFNTIGLARMVGDGGRVIAVDVQQRMLDMLKRRAESETFSNRIDIHPCERTSVGVSEPVDFVNAFWMVHEVLDKRKFLSQIFSLLKPNGHVLIAEPRLHVSANEFRNMVKTAEDVGFSAGDGPRIAFSRSVVLRRI